MRNVFRKSLAYTSCALAIALATGACSKNKPKEQPEVTDTAMQATDVAAAGQPIPELPTVHFEYDSFNLTASSKTALGNHAKWLLSNQRKVTIEGHADERGTTEYNLALGERRAAAVRDFLTGQGVPAARMNTISYGEERPADPASTESAWAKKPPLRIRFGAIRLGPLDARSAFASFTARQALLDSFWAPHYSISRPLGLRFKSQAHPISDLR